MLERYARQNSLPAVAATDRAAIAERLWRQVEKRGVPQRNAAEAEAPEMSAQEVGPLVAEILDGVAGADVLKNPARQLVKACFQAARRTCRESYRETTADGVCRRQVLARVRERVSGTHCVDCPYWTEFTAEEHADFLAKAWNPTGAEEFVTEREVFLPEDFRTLRRWLQARAREGMSRNT